MSHEGMVERDFAIQPAHDLTDPPTTPQEQLDAEIQRIVDNVWPLYLGTVALRDPDIDYMNALELNPDDEDDCDGIAQIVEACVSETLEGWEANERMAPHADTLALVMAFLGMSETKPPRGDMTLREFCLHQYDAYCSEQSKVVLAASAAPISATQRQDRVIHRRS